MSAVSLARVCEYEGSGRGGGPGAEGQCSGQAYTRRGLSRGARQAKKKKTKKQKTQKKKRKKKKKKKK